MNTPQGDCWNEEGKEVREALAALQQYLSDQLPPMLFAESFEHLLALPPSLVAEEMHAWVSAQYRRAASLPVSDYLFHAAKKIHVLKELQLVPREQIESFLARLTAILVHLCPDEDRPHLEADLSRLDEAKTVLAAPVEVIHQRAVADGDGKEEPVPPLRSALAVSPHGPEPGTAPANLPTPPTAGRGVRRLELLLQRLAAEPVSPGSSPSSALLPEVVAEAVRDAASADELLQQLTGLERLGAGTPPQRLLRLLASRLPDWAPPPNLRDGAVFQGSAGVVRKALSLSRDATEAARRLEELVVAAAEEFNSGSLGRAVTMLELALDTIASQRVSQEAARPLRGKGETLLAPSQLRTFAEDPDKVPLLRRALAFFIDLGPAELLSKLEREESRERRRFLLTLLVAHGPEARRLALASLREAVASSGIVPWQFERNLLHLLRRVPPPAEANLDDELDVILPLSQLGGPLAVVREALAVLGQMRSPRAEGTLIARVAELEDAATGVRPLPYQPAEVLGLLDRAVGALARSPASPARRCVVAHALKRKPQLGNTLARTAGLGEQDLANEPELVERLVAAVREELPVKVLGFTLTSGRKLGALEGLTSLLAGTRTPAVRALFAELMERFPGQPFAQAAARALAGAETMAASGQGAPATLSGDLALFGLPSLLQNLAESRVTGLLTLFAGNTVTAGMIRFAEGQVVAAATGPLTHKAAVYQLLVLPLTRFAFVQEPAPPPAAEEEGALAVLPLVMEGMRRLDEYRRACALLPDQARLRPGEQRPTRPPEEHDVALMRQLWARAGAGATVVECEREAGAEFFRVRRLLAHWLTEGALRLEEPNRSGHPMKRGTGTTARPPG